jgi:hypothetical protein
MLGDGRIRPRVRALRGVTTFVTNGDVMARTSAL